MLDAHDIMAGNETRPPRRSAEKSDDGLEALLGDVRRRLASTDAIIAERDSLAEKLSSALARAEAAEMRATEADQRFTTLELSVKHDATLSETIIKTLEGVRKLGKDVEELGNAYGSNRDLAERLAEDEREIVRLTDELNTKNAQIAGKDAASASKDAELVKVKGQLDVLNAELQRLREVIERSANSDMEGLMALVDEEVERRIKDDDLVPRSTVALASTYSGNDSNVKKEVQKLIDRRVRAMGRIIGSSVYSSPSKVVSDMKEAGFLVPERNGSVAIVENPVNHKTIEIKLNDGGAHEQHKGIRLEYLRKLDVTHTGSGGLMDIARIVTANL